MNKKKGLLFVVSGPSGVGKGTICDVLKERDDIYLSVSVTSRKPREGEIEGVSYFYKSQEEIDEMIKNGELLEHATYVNCTYGTPKENCIKNLEEGKNVILEIEIQGGLQVKSNYEDTVLIFVVPPKMKDIEERLRGRGTETEEKIQKRLERAKEEFSYMEKYDYIVVNDTVSNAVERINKIIEAESFKRKNSIKYIKEELGL